MTIAGNDEGNLTGSFAGLRVIDFSTTIAGPHCTRMLADMGAEIIKIETSEGETMRTRPPVRNQCSTVFGQLNVGKNSLVLDLKSQAGMEAVRRLVASADVLVENFRPSVMRRLKLDYASLGALNPKLIYCSISGYGQSGNDADRPGYDFVMQAESGLMAVTGADNGDPTRMGVAITDVACGMVAVQSILAALYERQRTGEGQYIDLALFDCALNLLINVGSGYLNTGKEPRRYGNAHATVVPYQIFETADGSFALAVGNDRQFAALCDKVVDLPQLARDTRFTTAKARANNRDELIPQLASVFRTNTRDHWMDACIAASVPAGIVKSVPEVFESDNVRERGVVQVLAHPHLGDVSLIRPAHGMEAQREFDFRAPPMLGQDTADILETILHYDEARIARLNASGAVAQYEHDAVAPH
jgi:crotonobetainyl-CoA:carnitine CoA-transferase CaiB-like acyl-CoA transferase